MPASIKHLSDKKVCYKSLLARWTDGLYYAAALTKVDKTKKTCRVAFEDGSEIWVSNRDVHIQLSIDQLSEDEDIVCCICDDGNSEPPNEIILCDVCQQGYHQKCHTPPVDSSKLDASEDTKDHKDWFCATCSYILNQTNRAKLGTTTVATSTQSQSQASKAQTPEAKPGPATPQASKSRQPPPASVAVVAAKIAATSDLKTPNAPGRQPPKVKQTPPNTQRTGVIGAIKPPSAASHHQRSAPYYPLSNQVRAAVASSSSTAALASMTASSALVVGSTAGRSKQDLVKQSNKSASQRQTNDESVLSPPKHAVRKSGVNFAVTPVKQSALPTATRSVPLPGTTATNNGASTKETAATVRPPATQIISTPSGGTLSVLTSPSKLQHAMAKPAEPALISTVVPTFVKDTNETLDSRVPQQQQQPTTTNVTSSDIVSVPQSKVTNNDSSESSKTAKKLESESVVHSTSDQRHITDSPQLEISFEHSPEQSMSPPVGNDHQQDNSSNPTMNGNDDRSKSTTVIVGGAGSQSS